MPTCAPTALDQFCDRCELIIGRCLAARLVHQPRCEAAAGRTAVRHGPGNGQSFLAGAKVQYTGLPVISETAPNAEQVVDQLEGKSNVTTVGNQRFSHRTRCASE